MGYKVLLRADTYPNRIFEGRVVRINDKAEFTPKSVQTKDERTRLVYGVKVDVLNMDGALLPGMPVEAELLFLDEPTAGLDVPSRKELHLMLRELRAGGAAIILATHDMAEAEQLADRVGILLRGRLVVTGSPLEITATGAGLTKISVHTRQNRLLQNGRPVPAVAQSHIREEYAIFYSADIAQTVPALIEIVQAAGDELLDLRVERPSLEERFLELTN